MTGPVPDTTPTPAPSSPPTGAPITAPPRPVPPRSRRGAHILSVLAGLVLTPVGLVALAAGAHGSASALGEAQEPSAVTLTIIGFGAAMLGIVAVAAAGSTLGPLVGGALYAVAPGIGFVLAPETISAQTESLLEPLRTFTGDGLTEGALILGGTGALLLLGLALVLVGVAAHVARRFGRRAERTETSRVQAGTDAAPTPPRSRLVPHAVAIGIGLVLTPLALALVAAGSVDIAVAASGGEAAPPGTLVWPWAVGTVLLAVVVLSAGWSSAGLLLGATAFGVVPGALGLLSSDRTEHGVSAFLAWVGDVVDPDAAAGLYALTTLGVLLTWGVIGVAGALGAHLARRDGRRRERAEIAVAGANAVAPS